MMAGMTDDFAVSFRPPMGELRLSLMSFNIHFGVGSDGEADLARLAAVMRTAQADVIALQEVDRFWSERSGFADQAGWLASELNMHLAYGANMDLDPPRPGAPRRQFGTAILSVWPILTWDNTYLPRFDGQEQRGLLSALIDVNGVLVDIYDTHLQFDDAATRREQAAAIVKLVGTPDRPTILMGDLNAAPGDPEVAELLEVFEDTWEIGGTGSGATYPAWDPRTRIDYILASADVTVVETAVIDTAASDHRPVRADVLVPAPGVS